MRFLDLPPLSDVPARPGVEVTNPRTGERATLSLHEDTDLLVIKCEDGDVLMGYGGRFLATVAEGRG